MLRESSDFVFAEYQFAVDFHIEDAAGTFDEFRFDVDRILNCCCQTDSLGRVVSHDAVGDPNFHFDAFFRKRRLL